MSREFFQEGCDGCLPAMIDQKTGKKMPDDDPIVQSMRTEFKKASRAEKLAWHNVTCSNSRDPDDLSLCQVLIKRMSAAAELS